MVVYFLQPLLGDLDILWLFLNADVVPAEFLTGYASSAGTHERIENRVSRV